MFSLRTAFTRMLSKTGSVAVWGWWQGRNLGDNWIRQTMLEAFPGADFVDTSTDLRRLGRYRFVVAGGGGLFIRGVHPAWRVAPKIPFGAIGLGAEFHHQDDTAARLSDHAHFFFVRDVHSVQCMRLKPETRSFDVTFFSPLMPKRTPGTKRVLFIWRAPGELLESPDFRQYIGPVATESDWLDVVERTADSVTHHDFGCNDNPIEALTDGVDLVVSARYHGLAAAIQRGIPCVAVDLCPKIRALMEECGLGSFCLKIGETGRIAEAVERCLDEAENVAERELEFTARAHTKLRQDVEMARGAIARCGGQE